MDNEVFGQLLCNYIEEVGRKPHYPQLIRLIQWPLLTIAAAAIITMEGIWENIILHQACATQDIVVQRSYQYRRRAGRGVAHAIWSLLCLNERYKWNRPIGEWSAVDGKQLTEMVRRLLAGCFRRQFERDVRNQMCPFCCDDDQVERFFSQVILWVVLLTGFYIFIDARFR